MSETENTAVTGKYSPLHDFLRIFVEDRWRASFAEVEAILGFPLPRSARTYQAWWANQSNSGSHTHAQSWQRAGWKARNVDLGDETLVFERVLRSAPEKGGEMSEGGVVQNEKRGLDAQTTEITAAQTASDRHAGSTHTLFEQLARWVMSDAYVVSLAPGKSQGVNKVFDMTSSDGKVVGDAKYFTMVGGDRLPPAKFSVIAEYVWLLEKCDAEKKFLVFGNDRRVPEKWLERYGNLVSDVAFFFLSDDGQLEVLKDTAMNKDREGEA